MPQERARGLMTGSTIRGTLKASLTAHIDTDVRRRGAPSHTHNPTRTFDIDFEAHAHHTHRVSTITRVHIDGQRSGGQHGHDPHRLCRAAWAHPSSPAPEVAHAQPQGQRMSPRKGPTPRLAGGGCMRHPSTIRTLPGLRDNHVSDTDLCVSRKHAAQHEPPPHAGAAIA